MSIEKEIISDLQLFSQCPEFGHQVFFSSLGCWQERRAVDFLTDKFVQYKIGKTTVGTVLTNPLPNLQVQHYDNI